MYSNTAFDIKKLFTILVLCFVLMLFWLFFNINGMALLIASPVALFLLVLGSHRWKLTVYIFLIWIIIEGALRKWIFPEYSSQIFLVKYVLIACPIFHFLVNSSNIRKKDYPFFSVLIIYILWGIFQTINPIVTNDIRVKSLGLMTHYAFIPLLYFVPLVFNDRQKIMRLFQAAVIISIPIFILGIVQYYSPLNSPVNKYIGDEYIVAHAGGKARITSVFSYITTYASYLTIISLITFVVLVIGGINKLSMIFIYLSGFLAIINAFMTGSRGVVFSIIAVVFTLLFLFSVLGLIKKKKHILSLLVLALICIAALFYTGYGKEAFSTFSLRTKSAGGVMERVTSSIIPKNFISEAGLIGYGIGTAYQGSNRYLSTKPWILYYVESENERIVVEMGLIGLVIFNILKLYIFIFTYNTYRRSGNRTDKIISLTMMIYQIPILLGVQPIVYNYVSGAIYWFFVALIVSINKNIREYRAQDFSYSPVQTIRPPARI